MGKKAQQHPTVLTAYIMCHYQLDYAQFGQQDMEMGVL